MKKLTLILTLFVGILTACAQQPKAPANDNTVTTTEEAKQPAIDFTLNNLYGTPLALSSLQGKYVVLDFWGSWCVWCVRGIPKMKEYYAKYKDKMEILGIDCGDTPEKWQAAVREHDIPWLHVYNPKESGLTEKYGIQGFPTKIVVDPKGYVIHTVIGEDPAFYTYLDELLGEK